MKMTTTSVFKRIARQGEEPAPMSATTTSSSFITIKTAQAKRLNGCKSSQFNSGLTRIFNGCGTSTNARIKLFNFMLTCCMILTTTALKCYEQTEYGLSEVENPSYKYCVLVPPMIKNGKIIINGSQFGIEPESDTISAYDAIFSLNMDSYQILTTCILERYEFPNPGKSMLREHMFRCVCNYDLCNKEPTFVEFLSDLTKHNDVSSTETVLRTTRTFPRLRAERRELMDTEYYA